MPAVQREVRRAVPRLRLTRLHGVHDGLLPVGAEVLGLRRVHDGELPRVQFRQVRGLRGRLRAQIREVLQGLVLMMDQSKFNGSH